MTYYSETVSCARDTVYKQLQSEILSALHQIRKALKPFDVLHYYWHLSLASVPHITISVNMLYIIS